MAQRNNTISGGDLCPFLNLIGYFICFLEQKKRHKRHDKTNMTRILCAKPKSFEQIWLEKVRSFHNHTYCQTRKAKVTVTFVMLPLLH